MSQNPYSSSQSSGPPPLVKGDTALDYAVIAPLCQVSSWLKFLGILNIIVGVLYCITIIGAIVGWLPLWIGVLLNNSATSLRTGYERRQPGEVQQGMERLALTIKIFGILALIGIVINVLYIGFVMVAIIFSMSMALQQG